MIHHYEENTRARIACLVCKVEYDARFAGEWRYSIYMNHVIRKHPDTGEWEWWEEVPKPGRWLPETTPEQTIYRLEKEKTALAVKLENANLRIAELKSALALANELAGLDCEHCGAADVPLAVIRFGDEPQRVCAECASK